VIAAMTCTDSTMKELTRDAGGGRLMVATLTDPDGNGPELLYDR